MSGDSYELLEVDRSSTIEEIRKKYYELKWSYDCRKELGKLEKDKEDEFNNITKAYHELSTNEHHLILSGYPIALAINSTDESLTEEEIEDILQKNDTALQELQDQEEKEVEEKFKKLDLKFQEMKDQQEYEAMEKQLKKADVLLSTVKNKERNESRKAEIRQIKERIKELKEAIKLFKLLDKGFILWEERTKLLETKTELSEQLSDLKTRIELKASYKKMSDIFMAATGVFIIVDSIIAVLFSMNLVSLEIMLLSTIASTAVSLICVGFAIHYNNQAFTEVDTELLNSTDQLNIEKFSQNKENSLCS
ncbi:DnaJ domain-containing protein [Wolbachia endosymbiont (group E) of Neria commutata]|uniref:DnaJ domain-containing protein n=1 Tax=Wolbachia endosymbiont (group E) of Neria commutata TaxID=3066149 RepID=UPI0031333B60